MIRRSRTDWIHPWPGIRRDEQHRYWLGDQQFRTSVTAVLRAGKSLRALDAIEATRNQWERRGTTVHRALEEAIKGSVFDPAAGEWAEFREWIDPLLALPLWAGVEAIASELIVWSKDGEIAGAFDGAFVTGEGRRVLFDLKTQASRESGPYDVRPQLGGYLDLAWQQGIGFDSAIVLWARPGQTRVTRYGVGECWDAWCEALERYDEVQSGWDPPRSGWEVDGQPFV